MKNTTAITRERSAAKESVSVELNKLGVKTIGITSGLIGCWAVACLGAGILSSGGPAGLVSNFASAFIG